MTTESAGVRLGDLLTGAGLLKPADLREAMLIAKQQGLPVGRVLIMSAYLTEHQLQAAVQAQSLLKDGLIDLETVVKALTLVGSEEVSLDEAFKRLKWQQEAGVLTNKLGELLFEAGIVSKAQLQSALTQCQTIGLPLGRVLVVTSVLSEQMLAAALNAQVLIRDKKVTREQAIQGLKSAKERQLPIEEVLAETGTLQLPTTETIRLGELLVGAGQLDEPNLMGAVELGLVNEQPIGQVLRQLGLITEDALEGALALQKKVAEGQVKKAEAPKVLGHARQHKVSIEEALKQLQPAPAAPQSPVKQETLPLFQFLQLAGLLTSKDIDAAVKVGTRHSEIMGKMLIASRVMEPFMVEAGYQCNSLIRQGILNTEQAIFALNYCNANGLTLDKTFEKLGWDLHPDFPGQPSFETSEETWPDAEGPTPTDAFTPDMVPAATVAAAPEPALTHTGSHQAVPAQPADAALTQTGGHQVLPAAAAVNAEPAINQTGSHQAVPAQAASDVSQSGSHPAAAPGPNIDFSQSGSYAAAPAAAINQSGSYAAAPALDAINQTGGHQALAAAPQAEPQPAAEPPLAAPSFASNVDFSTSQEIAAIEDGGMSAFEAEIMQPSKSGVSSPLQQALAKAVKTTSSPFKPEAPGDNTLFKHHTGEQESIGPITDPTLFKSTNVSPEFTAPSDSEFTSPWTTPSETTPAAPAVAGSWSPPDRTPVTSPWSEPQGLPQPASAPPAIPPAPQPVPPMPPHPMAEEDQSSIKTYEAIPVFDQDTVLAASQEAQPQPAPLEHQAPHDAGHPVSDAVEELAAKDESEKPKKRLIDFMPKFGQH